MQGKFDALMSIINGGNIPPAAMANGIETALTAQLIDFERAPWYVARKAAGQQTREDDYEDRVRLNSGYIAKIRTAMGRPATEANIRAEFGK